MNDYEFVQYPVQHRLKDVVAAAQTTLFVVAPYIKKYGVDFLLKHAGSARFLKILTNLDLDNICGDGFDVEALLPLWDKFHVSCASLGKLHAKAYIADDTVAFLTSANLTRGGLLENYEYGVLLREPLVVRAMLADLSAYFSLGNNFDRSTIEAIVGDVREIRDLRKAMASNPAARKLERALQDKQAELQTQILQNRVRGRTVNAILSETILYVLRTQGPLPTVELHSFIQNIHPDICDDTIDRVINGQHFGKKWKHLVRNAQQYLKRAGAIVLENGKWRTME